MCLIPPIIKNSLNVLRAVDMVIVMKGKFSIEENKFEPACENEMLTNLFGDSSN